MYGPGVDGPVITTPRLILRPPVPEDFEGWAAFAAGEAETRFLGGVQARAVAWRGFLSMAGAWAIQGFAMFSIVERESGAWIGRAGPWQPEGWPGREVGWGILEGYWGHGYATEAAAAAMDWAFAELGWPDVIHCIDAGNTASERVAERLGSRRLRTASLPPPFEGDPIPVWGQTAEEWRARRSADGPA